MPSLDLTNVVENNTCTNNMGVVIENCDESLSRPTSIIQQERFGTEKTLKGTSIDLKIEDNP